MQSEGHLDFLDGLQSVLRLFESDGEGLEHLARHPTTHRGVLEGEERKGCELRRSADAVIKYHITPERLACIVPRCIAYLRNT